jgi:hypothetical protein
MKKGTTVGLAVIGFILLVGLLFATLYSCELLPSSWWEKIYLLKVQRSNSDIREPKEFNFLVFGHLYGSPGTDDSIPALSITNRLPELTALDPAFMVSLGDMVYRNNITEFTNLQSLLLSKIEIPFYNTPGNHDVGKQNGLYQQFMGTQTYLAKPYGPAYLIFLDTESLECDLDEFQRKFLEGELAKATSDPQTRYILVFMHKTLVFQDPKMRSLKSEVAMPNVWKCQNKDGSNPLMEKYFRPAARMKPVTIFAGDVGAWGNLSPYYQHDPHLPLTLVMTGLGDTKQDNVIHVQVTPDGVKLQVIFLDTMQTQDLQAFNRAYWIDQANGK